MRSLRFTAALGALAVGPAAYAHSNNPEPRHILANPAPDAESGPRYRIPTSYESAVMGRRILALTPLATVSSVYPPSTDDYRRPQDVGGAPIGLSEYVTDCEGDGNPTLLEITIAPPFRNERAGSNVSVAVQWTPPYPPAKRMVRQSSSSRRSWMAAALSYLPFVTAGEDPLGGLGEEEDEDGGRDHAVTVYSAANLPRFSLNGYLEDIADAGRESEVARCFVRTHPDARWWLPGNPVHRSKFVRFVVTHVYWLGGFGDRAYIGWIPLDEWQRVTADEWQAIRLPGEKKGWSEWATDVLSLEL